MKVYRLIQFEGTALDLKEQMRLCVQGSYQPNPKIHIVATAVEPRIVEAVPMLMHALQLASAAKWNPPVERRLAAETSVKSSNPFAGDPAAAEFIKRIDELLESGDYDWAEDTLSGIRETVERTGRVTENQERAVSNIEGARQ
jgi:hypothetical protein